MNLRVDQMKWDELEKSGDESDIGGMTGEPGKESGREEGVVLHRVPFSDLR
jgi:hypothetical protein